MELQLGKEGLRGFSLADEYVPVVAVNTGENMQARIFTLMHELAHLASDTETACLGGALDAQRIERWSDEVASAAVLPRDALLDTIGGSSASREVDFDAVQLLADQFSVSLRATAVALIRAGLAEPSIYDEVDEQAPTADYDKGFGRAAQPRRAPRRRLTEVGPRAATTVLAALSAGDLSELEARRYLRLNGSELVELAGEVGASA